MHNPNKFFKTLNTERNNLKATIYRSFFPGNNESDKIVSIETQSYIQFDVHSTHEIKAEIKRLKHNLKQCLYLRNMELIPQYNLILDLPDVQTMPRNSNKVRFSLQLSITMTLSKSVFEIDKIVLYREMNTVIDLISLFGFEDGENFKIYKKEK